MAVDYLNYCHFTFMKTLVVSDLHLGKSINTKKLDFLYSLFSLYDNIVLNGDFWCYYNFNFKDFLESDWNKLFPVLKQRETVYIYGNHDKEEWCLGGANKFSNIQTERHILNIGDKKYCIEHGDLPLNILCSSNKLVIQVSRLINPIGNMISKTLNTNLDNNVLSQKISYFCNIQLKKYAMKNFTDMYYICGHTHYAEIDEKCKYVNTGRIGNRVAEFFEIKDNSFKLNSCII